MLSNHDILFLSVITVEGAEDDYTVLSKRYKYNHTFFLFILLIPFYRDNLYSIITLVSRDENKNPSSISCL